MNINYTLTRTATPPTRANPSDAGLDLFWNPSEEHNFIKMLYNNQSKIEKGIQILPGESVVLESGCKFAIPHGYCLEVKNRSSIASQKKLIVGAQIIDAGYEGEVFVNLINVGTQTQTLAPGDKIAQVVLYPVVSFGTQYVSEEELYKDVPVVSDRGPGGFGSSDAKKD